MAATSPAPPISFHSLAHEGRFYTFMAVFAFLFWVAAFGPSIVHAERRLGPITPLPAVHGIAFFAWLLLFIAQTILVRTGNLAHRATSIASPNSHDKLHDGLFFDTQFTGSNRPMEIDMVSHLSFCVSVQSVYRCMCGLTGWLRHETYQSVPRHRFR
jgi:hypothetical protein